jgi:hypothetical protein
MINNSTNDLHCLEVVCFVDIGGIVDHHCLEVVVCFVNIGEINDHHCLEVAVCFVDIVGIIDHHFLEALPITTKYIQPPLKVMVNNSTNINKTNNHL